jgi:hypothetical protein
MSAMPRQKLLVLANMYAISASKYLFQGCEVDTQKLRLQLLHKSSICINNGKPSKTVNDVIRHLSPPCELSGYFLGLQPTFKYKSYGYCS